MLTSASHTPMSSEAAAKRWVHTDVYVKFSTIVMSAMTGNPALGDVSIGGGNADTSNDEKFSVMLVSGTEN